MTLGTGSGDFVVGETVTQTVSSGKTVSGNVVSYSSVGESTKTLNVNNITFSDTDVPQQIQCLYYHLMLVLVT